ncbi:helix-turn-helix transcriptional regulator [Palleronia abyssalis]|uniref:HTH deoR-type domain-containing protein n=1 Tax=Palleronia abyssalis TaxID=1501240 RepID=A0A2R8BV69_9RHOB|nr:YafY family protein [Palleronia abyssalis]SPJ24068.1 hypothetical protein PAA8504_01893 [Palleronia abyssalis]
MARQDRLMRLMDALRRIPAPVTAARLAAETEVSPRQLYRDIATLRAGGALIDGAAGVGYTLTEDPVLPPQSFTRLEIEALMLGISSLDHLGDPALARAGRDAMARIVATLPDRQARQAMHTVLRSWRPSEQRPAPSVDVDALYRACWDEVGVRIRYRDQSERVTEREIWPLGLSFAPDTLTLAAFCLKRQDYRVFHVPRIEAMQEGTTSFRPRRVALLRGFVVSRGTPPATAGRDPADGRTGAEG